jgi:hypothetical protein
MLYYNPIHIYFASILYLILQGAVKGPVQRLGVHVCRGAVPWCLEFDLCSAGGGR